MKEGFKVRKIAFVGDHLPRKCGIATFTSDLLAAVAAANPESQCFSVSVNDIKGGYEYSEVVRFEIEEQDLSSYLRAADFLNISNVDIVCLQHEFGIFGGPAGGHRSSTKSPLNSLSGANRSTESFWNASNKSAG